MSLFIPTRVNQGKSHRWWMSHIVPITRSCLSILCMENHQWHSESNQERLFKTHGPVKSHHSCVSHSLGPRWVGPRLRRLASLSSCGPPVVLHFVNFWRPPCMGNFPGPHLTAKSRSDCISENSQSMLSSFVSCVRIGKGWSPCSVFLQHVGLWSKSG